MARFSPTERIGVNAVECIVLQKLRWIFREQETSDVGVDAHIEIVDENDPTGKMIGLQIKTGASHVVEKPDHFEFRGTKVHADYWLNHALPMILAVHLPDSGDTYWEILSEKTIRRTEHGFVIKLPKSKKLNETAYEELIKLAKSKRSLSERAIELSKSGQDALAKQLLIANEGKLDDESKVLLSVYCFNEKNITKAINLLSDIDYENLPMDFLQLFYVIKAECYSTLENENDLIEHIRKSFDFLNSKYPNPTKELGQKNPIDENVTSTPMQPVDLVMANSIRFRLCLILLEHKKGLISIENFVRSSLFSIGFGISRSGQFITDPESVMRAISRVFTNYNVSNTYSEEFKILTKEWLIIGLRSMRGIHEYIPFVEAATKITMGPITIPNVEEHIGRIESILDQFKTHYQLAD